MLSRLFARPHPLEGGIFLPRPGRTLADNVLRPFALPEVLRIPLAGSSGQVAEPVVHAGETVEPGQIIARGGTNGLHVHAPARGRIAGLIRVDTARRPDIPAIHLATSTDQPVRSGPNAWELKMSDLPDNWAPADPDDLFAAAESAGLTTFGTPAGELAAILREAKGGTRHLIVNTLPGEPVASHHTIESPPLLARACAWLARALGAERTSIAADLADRRTLRRLRAAARGLQVRVVGLVNKYPQHAPVVLASSIAGVETPPGRRPLEGGIVVLEAEAVLNLVGAMSWPGHEAVPMTHRVVMVAGPSIVRPGRYAIPLGTSFADILEQVGYRHTPKRVVDGGPLTGRAVAHLEVVTTKETSGLLVLDRANDRIASPGPCVRCGWCQEDCPVGLDPQLLLNYAERGDAAGAAPYFPQACIECGLCSYVCPAELPLATAAVRLRRVLQAGKNEP